MAVLADSGIEMHLAAAQALGLVVNPGEQLAGETLATGGRHGGEIVDVEVPPPAKAGTKPETGDSQRFKTVAGYHTDQPVAAGSLNGVDLLDELLQAGKARSQLPHGSERELGVRRRDLFQHA